MSDQYDDIIDLPHYEPRHHQRMTMRSRAAQFAPFAALTGFDAAIEETGRLTDEWIDKGELVNEQLNRRMGELLSRIEEQPLVAITFFQPDRRKEGGAYHTCKGRVKRYDEYERTIVMADGQEIGIDRVTGVELL